MADLSPLQFALLGLLAHQAQSGYELRKVFQETALGDYSDSPGSIYPALRKLEKMQLVRGQSERGGRRRRLFALTAAGRTALTSWLMAPVAADAAAHRASSVELKLAFVSDVAPGRLESLLREYSDILDTHLAALLGQRTAMRPKLSASAQLALDLGIHLFRARAAWCRETIQSL